MPHPDAGPAAGDVQRTLQQRFGNSELVRHATQQALQATAGGTGSHAYIDQMFEASGPPHSGLHGQRDHLAEAAAGVLHQPSARLRDPYPYRMPAHGASHMALAAAYAAASPPPRRNDAFLHQEVHQQHAASYQHSPASPSSSTASGGNRPSPRSPMGISAMMRRSAASPMAHAAVPGGSTSPQQRTMSLTARLTGTAPPAVHHMRASSPGTAPSADVARQGHSRARAPATAHPGRCAVSHGSPQPQHHRGRPASSPVTRSSGQHGQAPEVSSLTPAMFSGNTSHTAVLSPPAHTPNLSAQPPTSGSSQPSSADKGNASLRQRPVSAGRASPAPRSPSPSPSPQRLQQSTEWAHLTQEQREQRRQDIRQSHEEFSQKYRVKQHRQGYPDYVFSQPRSKGPMETVGQLYISFDEAHPAMAEQHYMRSSQQEALLSHERKALERRQQLRLGSPRQHSRSSSPTSNHRSPRSPVGSPSPGLTHTELPLRTNVHAGREAVAAESRAARQRAEEAITTSRNASVRHRSRSPSASPVRGAHQACAPTATSRRSASPLTAVHLDDAPEHMRTNAWAQYSRNAAPDHGSEELPLRAPTDMMPGRLGQADAEVDRVPGLSGQPSALHTAHESGPALSPEEHQMACGAFSASRYEAYERQVQQDMAARAQQQGYESDEERDRQAAAAAAEAAMTDEQHDAAARRKVEEAAQAALLQQTWDEQNAWMDEYRQRLGPREGYAPSPPRTAAGSPQPWPAGQHPASPGGVDASLTDDEEALLDACFVPILSQSLAEEGYTAERAAQLAQRRERARSAPRSFSPTQPTPFTFEERAANRPKTIMQVKLEQDLAIKQQELAAAKAWRFRASSVPLSNSPGKYEDLMLMAEVRRQMSRDARLQELSSMVERPFSFQERDEQLAVERQAVVAAAKDPNRFQVAFYAKPIPKHVTVDKFRYMMLELEAKRRGARERMEVARAKAKERAMQDVAGRQDQADRAYKERLRVVDPVWNTKYDSRRPGAVPDFNLLHEQWEQQLAKQRALTRRHLTVPREFGTNNTRSPAEKAAQERKALERRQRILLDMALDSELLPEQRWPYLMPRGRVRPTPPPPSSAQPDFKVSDTKANMMRRAVSHTQRQPGGVRQHRATQDKERAALQKARQDAQVRAAAYVKLKQGTGTAASSTPQRSSAHPSTMPASPGAALPAAPSGMVAGSFGATGATTGGITDAGSMPDAGGSTEKRLSRMEQRKALSAGRTDAPVQYIEARHAQAERQARMEIEDVLLAKGVYNDLRYTEG